MDRFLQEKNVKKTLFKLKCVEILYNRNEVDRKINYSRCIIFRFKTEKKESNSISKEKYLYFSTWGNLNKFWDYNEEMLCSSYILNDKKMTFMNNNPH